MRSLEPSFVLWFYSSPGQGSKLPLFKTSKKTFQNIVNSKYNAYLCSWCRNWNSWADIHSLVSTSGGGHTRSLDCCHTLDLFIFSAESSFKLYPLHLPCSPQLRLSPSQTFSKSRAEDISTFQMFVGFGWNKNFRHNMHGTSAITSI